MHVCTHGNQLLGLQVGWLSTIADDKAAGTDAITFWKNEHMSSKHHSTIS